MKKITAIILSIITVLSLCSMSAFAVLEDNNELNQKKYTKVVRNQDLVLEAHKKYIESNKARLMEQARQCCQGDKKYELIPEKCTKSRTRNPVTEEKRRELKDAFEQIKEQEPNLSDQKVCEKIGQEFEIGTSTVRRHVLGFESYKKYTEANKEKIKQYRTVNRDRIKEQRRQYYQEHKDKISEQQRQYYQDNKERINERCRQYYQGNQEKIKQYKEASKERRKEQQRRYREANQEKIRQYRKEHKNRISEQQKQYYQEHQAKIKEQHRIYREINQEKIRQYRKENQEKLRKQARQYYQEHKDQINQRRRKKQQ